MRILPDFCRIFQIRPRRNVQGTRRVPGGSPQFAFSRKTPHTAPPKKLAPAAALGLRPLSAKRRTLRGPASIPAARIQASGPPQADVPRRVDLLRSFIKWHPCMPARFLKIFRKNPKFYKLLQMCVSSANSAGTARVNVYPFRFRLCGGL